MESEWAVVPGDVLTKVLTQSSSLCCIARSVCKSWRQHALATPVALDIGLASPQEQNSLALWLQQYSACTNTPQHAGMHQASEQPVPLPLRKQPQRSGQSQESTYEMDDAAAVPQAFWALAAVNHWLLDLDGRNFDPDIVPEAAMAIFLGGNADLSATAPGQ